MPQSEAAPSAFFFALVAAAAIGSTFFLFSRNARLKRRLWPLWLIGGGLVILAFAFALAGPFVPLLVLIPVGLITYLSVRTVRFCDACGRTVVSSTLFSPPKFCQACGHDLTAGSPRPRT